MAISTYTELKAAVASWLHRDDLTTQIVDFITLAESRINRALVSRLAEVDASLTATTDSRYITLPSGFIHPVALWLNTYEPRDRLKYVTPDQLLVSTTSGNPDYWTVDGTNIAFDVPADQAYTYTFRYKKGYDIASTTTNDILTRHPDLYLYGSMLEAAIYTKDGDSLQVSMGLFEKAMQEISDIESKNRGMATLFIDEGLRESRGAYNNIIDGGY